MGLTENTWIEIAGYSVGGLAVGGCVVHYFWERARKQQRELAASASASTPLLAAPEADPQEVPQPEPELVGGSRKRRRRATKGGRKKKLRRSRRKA